MARSTILKLEVELTINNRDLFDKETLISDLVGELVKVKSGLYENVCYGSILSATPIKQKVQRA